VIPIESARRAPAASAESTSAEAQSQVQQKPLAMVSGVKSQAHVIEAGTAPGGGAPENLPGGGNRIEPQAMHKPPGGGPRPPGSPVEAGGPSRPQVSEPAGGPSPKRGSRGTTTEAAAPTPKAKLKLLTAEDAASSVKPGEGATPQGSKAKPVASEEAAAVTPKGASRKAPEAKAVLSEEAAAVKPAEGAAPRVRRSVAIDDSVRGGGKRPDITVPEKAPASGAGSLEHKTNAWNDYKARGGEWPYEQWSNVYSANMERAKVANAAADKFFNEEGHASWGERERVVDIAESAVDRIKARFRRMEARTRLEGNQRRADFSDLPDPTKRRLDIGPSEGSPLQRGIEHKTGYVTRSDDVLWEAARDIELAQSGWDIQWVIEGDIVGDLQRELERAGIKVVLRR